MIDDQSKVPPKRLGPIGDLTEVDVGKPTSLSDLLDPNKKLSPPPDVIETEDAG